MSAQRSGVPGFFAARTVSQWGGHVQLGGPGNHRLSPRGVRARRRRAVVSEIPPVLAFGFVAGAVVDRLPRLAVMIGADPAGMVVAECSWLSSTMTS